MYGSVAYSIALFVSFIVLLKSSSVVVKSSIRLARITRLGEMVIGFLMLSIATNVPELSIAFNSIITQNTGITMGNILGSDVVGITLILGIISLIRPIKIPGKKLKILSTVLFLTTLIPITLLFQTQINRPLGILLIFTFLLFVYYSVKKRITLELKIERPTKFIKKLFWSFEFYKNISILIFGITGVVISSWFVVTSVSGIATLLGIEQAVIGATIISIGTQLPELTVSLMGVKKGHFILALGNLLGSNLVKLTLILGIVLASSPFLVDLGVFSTLLFFVIFSTILVWHFLYTGRTLDRTEGIILLFIYTASTIFVFVSGLV